MGVFNRTKPGDSQDDLFSGTGDDVAVLEDPSAEDVVDTLELADESSTAAEPEVAEELETEIEDTVSDAPVLELGKGSSGIPPSDFSDIFSDGDDGESARIDGFTEKAYLEYAISMVKGRALPYCQDGQKPVHRRILYAMRQMGLVHNAKHVKSARVVGDVLGKFHPHGDSSAYDASVRLAQRFVMRYPLIDGQGNFGSRDGDSAAAMRYTEMRLTPISELLLSEIDEGTVDFVPNYDGAFSEPSILPARLPMLLMNGSEGVAVGMATKIPPHNLLEVSEAAILAVNGHATFDGVMQHIQGPDFPEGGQVINTREEILDAYRQGSGTFRIRARWRAEQLARGQYRIIVEELPYGVGVAGAAGVMVQIDEIANPKPKKNKKSLDAEQLAYKQTMLSMLDKVRNESGKTVRIVIEPQTSKINPEDIMNFLFARTDMEVTYSINMTMMGIDGKPARKGIVEFINEWATFRIEVVTRRTQFALDKALKRIHILEGRMIAFLNIEEVIRVIREADDPKADLIQAFKLTDIQAEDILEIRLRQLASIEGIKIESEMKSLREEADRLRGLLDSNSAMRRQVVKEMREDMKRFGDERRTLMESVERVKVSSTTIVQDEPMTVIISKQGWIRSRQGHGIDVSAINWRPGDGIMKVIETRSVHPVILLDQTGRAYSVLVSTLPGGKGDGVPLSSLVDLQSGAKITQVISAATETRVLMCGERGYGFIAPLGNMVARVKAGKAFMTLSDKESMMPPVLLGNESHVALLTEKRMLVFELSEVKALNNGGMGVQLIIPDDGCKVTRVSVHTAPLAIEVPGKRKASLLQGADLEKYVMKRARKGCAIG